jgi:hypothetical protein
LNITPTALLATISFNLLRRPLLRVETVQDCLGKSRDEVDAMIQDGSLAYAFDISTKPGTRTEPRIFTLCVAEKTGWRNPSGQTKNYQLAEVVGMILPQRDVRSTELRNLFACSCDHIYQLANNFKVTRKPAATGGPNSYTVFSRASIETFLTRRVIK